MIFKYTKIHATILALGAAGLFQVTPAFAQNSQVISNITGLAVPGCNTIAVFGSSKPKDCINDSGKYVDSYGNVSDVSSNNNSNNNIPAPQPDNLNTTVYDTRPTQVPSCDSVAVFGPGKPKDCMNASGQYVSDELDVKSEDSPLQCGGNITTKCYTNDDGYIDANGKRFDLNSKIGMTESYSILACENVVDNMMFKGQADYLPLWNPPQHTISDITFTMEPRFSPTDLIFNNVNYGKGAVLLSNSTKTNPRTGATISLDNQPVIMNNCNIKWVVPAWVYEELERRARAARESDGGGAVFGPGNGNSAPRILLGIDAEGYRIGMDGQRLESQESESLRSYYVERLEKNSESGFGMYWEDMEWNPDAGLWLPTGGERNVTDRDYMY